MAKSAAERQKEYERRKIEAGWKRVPVWVPKEKVADLRSMVEELIKEDA